MNNKIYISFSSPKCKVYRVVMIYPFMLSPRDKLGPLGIQQSLIHQALNFQILYQQMWLGPVHIWILSQLWSE